MIASYKDFYIRQASVDDAERISQIYAPYVEHTAITFEYQVPSPFEFKQRISATLAKYPYLVACRNDGLVVGYAYAGTFKGRAAYDWAAELSVYVDAGFCRHHVGSALYGELEKILLRQNITNLYACITYSDTEDAMHNNDSIRFHEREGFVKTAHFHNCGYKFSRWWDMVWLEKFIAPHRAEMKKFIPFSGLDKEL